jgi:uncharacterized protein
MIRIAVSSLLLAAMSSAAVAEPPSQSASPKWAVELKGKRLLENFDFHGVTLDAGPLRKQVDEAREDYLRIPNDDLLEGFRQRAGLPAPGQDLGGWYSGDVFHVFGQIISGLSRLYAATGDPACREKVNTLVAEWSKCIAPDGYFFYSTKPNAPHYIYDKLVGGLVDAHIYCGTREALPALSRITDWAIKHLERSRKIADNSTEWYTLSENLYRAYLATGDEKFRDFAQVWEYSEYWNIYLRGASIFAPRPDGKHNDVYHAYSHVNTLGGAGAAFLVKGNTRYLELLKNAYDFLDVNEFYSTGGYGPDEQLLPRSAVAERLGTTTNTFETQCGTWAGFKMAKYLIRCTGDAKYGDWVERLALNGIGANIPMTSDGRVFYYSDYNTHGGEKRRTDFGWSCCTGTRPQAVADLADQVYYHDAGNLYVNLFTPATVKWNISGASVTIRQQTRFPDEPQTQFIVAADHPAEFAIELRTPGWLASPIRAELNGQPVQLTHDDKGWARIRRRWSSGDKLTVSLPMRLSAHPITENHSYPFALTYGPVVLAASTPNTKFVRKLDLAQVDGQLTAVPGEPLAWQMASESAVVFRPFYAYKQGEPYFLYLDPTTGRRLLHGSLTYQRPWNSNGQFHFTNVVGATVEATFEGTGIRWLGYKYDDAGQVEVTIDDKVVATVDQYGPGRDLSFDWSHNCLSPGKHTIRLKVLESKDSKSKDHFINVAGFDLIGGE